MNERTANLTRKTAETEVKTTLTEATGSFVTLPVAADCDIRTLVEKSLGTGSFKNWSGVSNSAAEGDALFAAEIYLDRLVNGGPSTGNYQLTLWQSPDSQDILQASTASSVPEPTSLMLGALGLAGLSVLRRRKSS